MYEEKNIHHYDRAMPNTKIHRKICLTSDHTKCILIINNIRDSANNILTCQQQSSLHNEMKKI